MQVSPPVSRQSTATESLLRAKAAELETAFLSEMLRHTGLGAQTGSFSGGVGEGQFASFLREAQTRSIVSAGGIGLAEPLFRALAEDRT